jgi:hypothetical protein
MDSMLEACDIAPGPNLGLRLAIYVQELQKATGLMVISINQDVLF